MYIAGYCIVFFSFNVLHVYYKCRGLGISKLKLVQHHNIIYNAFIMYSNREYLLRVCTLLAPFTPVYHNYIMWRRCGHVEDREANSIERRSALPILH